MPMKWYWAIGPEGEPPKRCYVGDSGSLYAKDTSFLWSGTAVVNWHDTHTITSASTETDGEPLDVLISHLSVPVFSARLQMAVRSAGINNIQFLPIRVLKSDQQMLPGFAIANILSSVNALDLNSSRFQRFPADSPNFAGEIRSLETPVLLGQQLTDFHIVRLQQYLFPIFISDYFRRLFEEGGFTGYQFVEISVA